MLVVYGGMNENGILLKDLWTYHLETKRWTEVLLCEGIHIDENEDRIGNLEQWKKRNEIGIYFHKMCAVLWNCKASNYADALPISKPPGKSYIRKKGEIKYEGLYVFGGKNSNGFCTNEIKFLKVTNPFLHWIYPKCKGKPPKPRYGHTMHFHSPLASLIIYGG